MTERFITSMWEGPSLERATHFDQALITQEVVFEICGAAVRVAHMLHVLHLFLKIPLTTGTIRSHR